MSRRRTVAAAILGAALLAGCAGTPVAPARLTPARIEAATHHPGAVQVQALGGCDPCSIGQAQISNEGLAEAVIAALRDSGVWAGARRDADAPYRLTVQLFRADTPFVGLDMRSEAELGWTLARASTGQVVWRRAIRTSHVATFGDSPIGQIRSEMAWQGAVRANIAEGVAALSRLSLPPAP